MRDANIGNKPEPVTEFLEEYNVTLKIRNVHRSDSCTSVGDKNSCECA